MDSDTAIIWIRVGNSKKNIIVIGGVYRHHQLLGGTGKDATRMEIQREQEVKCEKVVKRCNYIARNYNLDHQRWSNPVQHLENMVELTKTYVEGSGCTQMVTGHTRTWRKQTVSLLDQVWNNCGQKTLKIMNENR